MLFCIFAVHDDNRATDFNSHLTPYNHKNYDSDWHNTTIWRGYCPHDCSNSAVQDSPLLVDTGHCPAPGNLAGHPTCEDSRCAGQRLLVDFHRHRSCNHLRHPHRQHPGAHRRCRGTGACRGARSGQAASTTCHDAHRVDCVDTRVLRQRFCAREPHRQVAGKAVRRIASSPHAGTGCRSVCLACVHPSHSGTHSCGRHDGVGKQPVANHRGGCSHLAAVARSRLLFCWLDRQAHHHYRTPERNHRY